MFVEFSGENLRRYRKKNNLTVKQLSEMSGVAERYIYLLEHCERDNPTVKTLRKLSGCLFLSFY